MSITSLPPKITAIHPRVLVAIVVTVLAWASAFLVIRGVAPHFSGGALALGRLLVGSVLLAGAAATAISLAPIAAGQPVDCADPANAASGTPCLGTGDPTEFPAPPAGLTEGAQGSGPAKVADCAPGRVCEAP